MVPKCCVASCNQTIVEQKDFPQEMSPDTVNVLGLLGLVMLGVGELLHIVGLATPEWSVSIFSTGSVGLWELCTSTCNTIIIKTTELQVCEAFAIIGMLVGLLAAALGFMFLVFTQMKKNVGPLAMGVAAAGNVALGSILLCVIVWGAATHSGILAKIGYSFALSLAGGIILSIGGDIIFIMSRQRS